MLRRALLFPILVCFVGGASAREPLKIRLRWDELSPHVTGKKIAFVLPDGTSLEGKARGVEADGLRMRVSRTSNRNVHPKGERLIPRQSLSVIRMTEHRGWARLIGAVGAMGAALGIVAAQQIDVYEGPAIIAVPAAVAAGTIGAGIAGYYIGKAIDKRVTEISIAPPG